ncbi:MAG: M23 family metallopeptidase [Patescibacteria group bacterium]
MLQISLNLSKYRLALNLSRRRKASIEDPILPSLTDIQNTRSGHKISRFFRHIFEHKNIKKILGSNLAFVIIASTIIPTNSVLATGPTEDVVLTAPQKIETEVGVHYPMTETKVNQGYSFFHPGIDFEAKKGDVVTPIMAGKVKEIGWDITGYGNIVLVSHGDGMETLYAHLSKTDVKVNQEVTPFTKIGEAGSTGRSTGSHLHFEIRKNGIRVNPFTILPRIK